MLKTLILKNLVLIEKAEIDFEKGFTIITGETGAGKTALIEGLRLILGERADASKVRKGCEKAFIQAAFAITPSPSLHKLLDQAGLSFLEEEEEFILTREISAAGKSRAYACGQMVAASFLQQIAPYLIDFVGQHAQIILKNADRQRELLDLYADVDFSSFLNYWETEKQLQRDLKNLQIEKAQSEQRQEELEEQIQELKRADLKEEEEESSLFEEYTLQANAQELLSKSSQALEGIEKARQSSASVQNILQEMEKFTSELKEPHKIAKEAQIFFEELQLSLQSFSAKLDMSPDRLIFFEERLKTLDHLKKKYGENPLLRLQELEKELETAGTLDEREEALKQVLLTAKGDTAKATHLIHEKRAIGAQDLQQKLSIALRKLNIGAAEVQIHVLPTQRTKTGEDEIIFYLRANKGEQITAVKESSSGGELSRLLFVLKLALANKSKPPTMIFDEIDANVGGKTATLIGEELKELGQKRQVLCVTHFPQVARQGDHHICVSKRENQERTEGQITTLSKKEREQELLRMLGGTMSAV